MSKIYLAYCDTCSEHSSEEAKVEFLGVFGTAHDANRCAMLKFSSLTGLPLRHRASENMSITMIHHGRKITARVESSILVSDQVGYCPWQNWFINRFAESCLECCIFDTDEATEESMTAAEARWIDGMLPEARIYIRNSKREEGLQGFYIEMHETASGLCLEVMIDRCFEDGKDCRVQFTTSIIVRNISRPRDL